MRLVSGGVGYVFGGQGVRTERASFEAFGVPFRKYRPATEAKTVAEMSDFYLDETEVTVAQFLAFVRNGYNKPEHWKDAPTGYAKRTDDVWIQELQKRDGQLPVTGIDFFEAVAFANWAGKRLPTVQEWEYAVRGGLDYRPFSCAAKSVRLDMSKFNVAGGGAPWKVKVGVDKTPGGIFDLCSNVSEWTAPLLLGTDAYAAGASFEEPKNAYYFNKVEKIPARERHSYLGFRCALDAVTMDRARDGKDDGMETSRDEKQKK